MLPISPPVQDSATELRAARPSSIRTTCSATTSIGAHPSDLPTVYATPRAFRRTGRAGSVGEGLSPTGGVRMRWMGRVVALALIVALAVGLADVRPSAAAQQQPAP